MTSKISVEEAREFYKQAFPGRPNASQIVVTMEDGFAVIRQEIGQENIRPGGYVSGPTQMALADAVAYMAVFTKLGIVPMAVTSNLSMNFLRPCVGEAIVAEGRIMKIGRTLAVIETEVRAEGSDKISSHAIVTYSLPLNKD